MTEIRQLPNVHKTLLAWHDAHGMHAPWRESRDPYACLVAAVMAQQTQMSRVMPSYERFVSAFPTVDAFAAASRGDVIRVWTGMGYNTRAVRLHRAAQQIAAAGEWPRDAASLAQIDGIGPFTAAIVASFAFGEVAACVDTNVRRVLGRLAGDETMGASAMQRLADAAIAPDAPARWNQVLMDYGASICTPRPKCGECAVGRWCGSRQRYAAGTTRSVADERATYGAGRETKRREAPFAGSSRWYRGRIIALLRDLPRGESLPLRALPALLRNGHGRPPLADIRTLAAGLERDGLAVVRDDAVSLPE